MTVPAGWSLYSEDHEDVPTTDGATIRNHTWRYAPDPERPQAAAIALEVMEGDVAPGALDAVLASEPSARPLSTTRSQPVTLMREEAGRGGLTYATWAESAAVHVSVIGRGDVSVDDVVAAVNSVRVPG